MQFLVLGYDGDDAGALERRLAVREDHLAVYRRMHGEGKWLYAAAILDDGGKMIGSMIVCDFASREEMDEQWLRSEPYVRGAVWKRVEVRRAQVAPLFARNPD